MRQLTRNFNFMSHDASLFISCCCRRNGIESDILILFFFLLLLLSSEKCQEWESNVCPSTYTGTQVRHTTPEAKVKSNPLLHSYSEACIIRSPFGLEKDGLY